MSNFLAEISSIILPVLLGLQIYDLQNMKKDIKKAGEDIARFTQELNDHIKNERNK
jgi:hypothetical protein